MAAQLPDIIILNGEKMELYSNPLEQYWASNDEIRPLFVSSVICRRGYIATWELIDKLLMLRRIDGDIIKKYFYRWTRIIPYSLEMMFPEVGGNGILASWFTGKIRIPQGNQTLYVHHEYDSRFERELIITIKSGIVIKSVVLDYSHQKLEVEVW